MCTICARRRKAACPSRRNGVKAVFRMTWHMENVGVANLSAGVLHSCANDTAQHGAMPEKSMPTPEFVVPKAVRISRFIAPAHLGLPALFCRRRQHGDGLGQPSGRPVPGARTRQLPHSKCACPPADGAHLHVVPSHTKRYQALNACRCAHGVVPGDMAPARLRACAELLQVLYGQADPCILVQVPVDLWRAPFRSLHQGRPQARVWSDL